MAGAAVIGALRITLGADTAAFESGMNRAKAQATSFAGSVTRIAAGIGLAHGLESLLHSYVNAFKVGIEHADKMSKAAQKVGLSVEEFTKLKLAADLSDVSMESLSAGLGKLSKAMVEVARGGGDAAGLAFRQLGVSVREADGSMKSTSTVLAEVAGKFSEMSDGASKTAIAMAIFGRGGKDLIPMLNEGKEGIEEWAKVAERMGLVIGEKTAAQSQKFNDNMKLISLSTQGVVNRMMEGLLPVLVKLSNQFVQTAKDGTGMITWADGFNASVRSVVINTAPVLKFLSEWSAVLEASRALRSRSRASAEESAAAMEEFGKRWAGAFERMMGAREEARRIFDEPLPAPPPPPPPDFNPAIGKAIEDLAFKTRILNQEFSGLADGFPELAKGLVPIDQIKTAIGAMTPAMRALNEEQLRFKGTQLTQENLLPWQQYELQLTRIDQLLQRGVINHETYSRAMKAAADKAGVSWGIAGASIADSFATIAGSFGESNKKMAIMAKAFAIVNAVISAFEGASKALTLPFPANLAAAAAVLAKGFTFVAAIKSQAVPKFSTGGAIVPGGIGGGDRVRAMVDLEPGEQLDIWRPGQGGPDPRRGGGSTEITIRGLKGRDFFTGNMLRDLVDNLNQSHRDGYRLKFDPA